MSMDMDWSERKHIRVNRNAYAHGGKKARESQSHVRRLSGVFFVFGESYWKERNDL